MFFHEEKNNAETVEYNFIKFGLEKNQHCFYTTNDPRSTKQKMKEFGIPVEASIEKGVLNIVEIPKSFEEYAKIIEDKVASLPKDKEIRVVSTHYFDFNSDEKAESMEKIEHDENLKDSL